MFGFLFKSTTDFPRVERAADRGIYTSIKHAALSIRKTIRESIKKSTEPSEPGQPVATRRRSSAGCEGGRRGPAAPDGRRTCRG